MDSKIRMWRHVGMGVSMLGAFSALSFAAELAGNKPVTFAKDIAPIFQEKCQDCHRAGSMAPMSLVTYEESRPWARSIRERVIRRQMPPWHIDKTVGVQKFKNDMSLSDEQIATVVAWVDSGAQQGNPKDMPPAKQWPAENEWRATKDLGQPDLIVEGEAYTMPAHHQDVWWRPATDIGLTEPRWVRAVEMRPTTPQGRKIIHHAVAYLDQNETVNADSPDRSAAFGGRGMLMEWAIGKGYDLYRPNTGKLLLPGSKISWDMHIHAVGEEVTSGVQIGIWLYPKGQEPKYRTYLTAFSGLRRGGLDIPPNTLIENEGFTVLRQPAILENIQPHMHLRGKAMSLEAILPDGTTQVVSYVGNFNFNWMTNYIYADDAAPEFPKGTIIKVTSWHDNTRANPNNPDPDQEVTYGDRTVDEMAHAWVNVTYISDEDYNAWAAEHKAKRETARAQ
jgi:mono/diheme cytochrome c family protein